MGAGTYRSTRRRWQPGRAVVLGAALSLAAGPAALAAPADPTPAGSPTPNRAGGARGEELFRQNCASCHGQQGQGSQRGPSLVGVGPASVDFQLSTGRMPIPHEIPQPGRGEPVFSSDEIAALVDHVGSFGGGGPQIPRVAPGSLTAGRELYAANCAPCHGATGSGAPLTNGWIAPPLYEATSVQVAEAIRVGPGLMPVFPSQVLTDEQVNDLTTYVRRLGSEHLDRGGNPLGRLGPLAEGLVGWIVTLGLLVAAARWLGRRAGE
ncbi:c-type cytochrome [Micromonospora sp. NPDC050686]|uniref:cytochrome bc1 complex diheme cytochrome c subunit n=1 Tax=Micromonospora sp. NPDC050686 TaxID=3154631 RepID=UPI003400EBDF